MNAMNQDSFMALLKKHDVWVGLMKQDAPITSNGQIALLGEALQGISLENTNLSGSAMVRCTIGKSVFRECNFSSALMMETRFIECEFHECSFAKTSLQDTIGRGSKFLECQFIKSDFSNSDFSGCDFTGSDLSWSLIVEADFRNANLHGTRLNGSRMYRSKLYNPVKQKIAEAKDIAFQDIDISLEGNGSRLIQADGIKQIFDL